MLKYKCVSSFYLVVLYTSKSSLGLFACVLFSLILLLFHSCSYYLILFCFVAIIFTELPAFQMIRLHKIPRIEIDHHFKRGTTKRTGIWTLAASFFFFFLIRHAPYYCAGIHYLLTLLFAFTLWVYRTNVFLLSCYTWRPTELIRCINNYAHVRVSQRKNNWSKTDGYLCSGSPMFCSVCVDGVDFMRKKNINFERKQTKNMRQICEAVGQEKSEKPITNWNCRDFVLEGKNFGRSFLAGIHLYVYM